MSTFGELLGSARKSSGRFVHWLGQAEPDLAARLTEAAAHAELTPSGYVRVAVADFSRFADEEDWATLSSTLKNSGDPAVACLLSMIHWRLTQPCCDAHQKAC